MNLGPAELAARALAAVPRGTEAQALVTAERSLLTRFARSRPTQATAVDDLTVEVTAWRDGHTGGATTNRTDASSLEDCARQAVAAAESSAREASGPGSHPGPSASAPVRAHGGHDPDTARLDPAVGGEAVREACRTVAATDAEGHGIWSAAEVSTAIATTAGAEAADRVTDAFMKVTAIAPEGRSGYDAQAAVAADALAPERLARRAAEKATTNGDPATLGAGEYPVVFERYAVGDLLSFLGHLALNGLAFAEGRSALTGRIGDRVAAARVNLSDSPRYPGTLPRAFDAEGVPKSPLPLIQDGVAMGVVHDRRSGALAGAASTGHGLAPGGASSGPAPTNLVMIGGGAESTDELCRTVERGVYVTRLWYMNPVRPKETLVTGVTRDGTFLIEDGRVTRPLADLRLTDSVLGLLSRVEELEARPALTGDGEFYGRRFATGVVCPGLRVSAARFTA